MNRDDDPAPPDEQPRNRLHGVTLERLVTELVARLGWEELGRRVRIRCFTSDPSVASSLSFLRKNPWAREKVEILYRRLLIQEEIASRERGGAT